MDIIQRNNAKPFITKDGSEIRELLAYRNSSIKNQSLAEAAVPIGGSTDEHIHKETEEIYYILQGVGKMRVENEEQQVKIGDAVAILPGQKHKISNIGNEPLIFLCCCAPCYEHDDTVIME
jgi:mannose-6-phosphate isomerase-like protein (cupin superfamily)